MSMTTCSRPTIKRFLLPLFGFLASFANPALTADWSGNIPNGTTWPAGQIQRIVGDATVPAGSSLTIGEGAIIKFNIATDLYVDGTLNANGSSNSHILFTSDKDDTGGDTNGDGNATLPAPGSWNKLDIRSSGSATLIWVDLRYGGSRSYSVPGSVLVNGGDLDFNNGSVRQSDTAGIRVLSSEPTITGVSFQDNKWGAVQMNVDSDPLISAVSFTNNGVNGVAIDGGTLSLSRAWDDPDTVYSMTADVRVPETLTLTIGSGQVVKPNLGVDLYIDGILDVNGTVGSPVYFVSSSDDSHGGDTNNDTNLTSPDIGQWNRINIGGTGSATLDWTHIAHGGDWSYSMQGNLVVDGGSLIFNNGSVNQSNRAGIRILNADPTISNVSFQDNELGAIQMNVDSDPTISNVSFTNNGVNGTAVDGGTLSLSRAWNDPDTVYSMTADVRVPETLTLTIGSGQVVKPNLGVDLYIDGILDVNGTVGSPVYFVSSSDDSHGGDTNNDTNLTSPDIGQWNRINIGGTGSATLDWTHIAHGGDWSYSMQGNLVVDGGSLIFNNGSVNQSDRAGIRILNADPTISNVSFQDNELGAIQMNVDSDPTISNVSFTNNGVNGTAVDGGTLSLSRAWNDPDTVYSMTADVTVPDGLTLTIGSGQVIKPNLGVDLYIDGVLDVNGILGSPVYFVSSSDDSHGGDTNNDANLTSPDIGQWNRINIGGTGSATLDWTHIAHGGDWSYSMQGNLVVDGGSLIFNNGSVNQSNRAGIRILNADPTISNVSFQDNELGAIQMNVDSDPTISNVSFTNNGVNGTAVDGGTLSLNRAWDDPDTVYSMTADVRVPETLTLTIGSGQVVKPNLGVDLYIDGILDVNGTVGSPVYFVSSSDDSHGGDTNNDANLTSPDIGQWNRINIGGTGSATLDWTHIAHGGDWSYSMQGNLVVDGGSLIFNNGSVNQSDRRGIYVTGNGSLELTNNLLYDNQLSGLETADAASATVTNNSFNNNETGVRIGGSQATLVNNIISNHSRAGIDVVSGSAHTVQHNDVYNPAASLGNFVGLADLTGTDGNLSSDPIFANPGAGMFQILSSSPAIDSGTSNGAPSQDFFGNSRFDDPGVANTGGGTIPYFDMGAIERQEGSDPINLVVENVAITPDSGEIGEWVTINWTVRNVGTGPAPAPWSDAVFASIDDTWDISDQRLDDLPQEDTLFPGEFYNRSVDVQIPKAMPGDINFIIRTDYRKQVAEVDESNDILAVVEVVMPIIPLDRNLPVTLTQARPEQYFQIPISSDFLFDHDGILAIIGSLGIDLDDMDNQGLNEMYVARDALPTRENAIANPPAPDQRVSAWLTQPGVFIVLARVNKFSTGSTQAEIEMSAAISPFEVTSFEPISAGNQGTVTLRLEGVMFSPDLTAQLSGPGGTIDADAIHFENPTLAYATFDLTGQAVGSYSVHASQTLTYLGVDGDGTDPDSITGDFIDIPQGDTAPGHLILTSGGGADLSFDLQLPNRVRAARAFEFELKVENRGNNDAPAPIVLLSSKDGVGFVDNELGFTTENGLLLILSSTEGQPSIIRPGQSSSYLLKATAPNTAGSSVAIDVGIAHSSSGGPDYSAWISALGEDPLSSTWKPIVADLKSTFGQTWPAFSQALRSILDDRSLLSHPVANSIRLLLSEHIANHFPIAAGQSSTRGAVARTIPPSVSPPETRVTSGNPRRGLTGKQYLGVAPGTNGPKWRTPDCSWSNRSYATAWVGAIATAFAARTAASPLGTLPTKHIVAWNNAAASNQTEIVYGLGSAVSNAFRENFSGRLSFSRLHIRIGRREAIDIIEEELDKVGLDNAVIPDFDIKLHNILNAKGGTASPQFYFVADLAGGSMDDASAFFSPLRTATNQFSLWASFGSMQGAAATVKNVRIVKGKAEAYVSGIIRYAFVDRYEYDGDDGAMGTDAPFYDLEWCAAGSPAGFDNKVIVEKPFKFEYVPIDALDPDPEPLTPPTTSTGSGSTRVVGSFDPNDKVTVGRGETGWIKLEDDILYRIFFENDPKFASAPAQKVTITDVLDKNLDLSRFEVVGFAFGDQEIIAPPGLQSFKSISAFHNMDGSPLNVSLSADLDTQSGTVTWVLDSVDPDTGGAPTGIDDGFLPVNDESKRGEGHVSFRIRPKPDTTFGTEILNHADIVFDQNSAIVTPTTVNMIMLKDIPNSCHGLADETITGPETYSDHYYCSVDNWIKAGDSEGVTVGEGGYVIYSAREITLKPGFSVKGGIFRAGNNIYP